MRYIKSLADLRELAIQLKSLDLAENLSYVITADKQLKDEINKNFQGHGVTDEADCVVEYSGVTFTIIMD